MPEDINSADLLPLAVQQKVAFVPGGPFHPRGGGLNTMRLNFSNAQPDKIQQAIYRLSNVIKEYIASK